MFYERIKNKVRVLKFLSINFSFFFLETLETIVKDTNKM